MAKEITIFAKRRQNKEGKTFTSYLTTLTKKTGETVTAAVKFRDEAGTPKECPCNIVIDKNDVNMNEREYVREDTGDRAKAYTLWVSKWKAGSKYVDHSMDDYDI